ncbi:MAG: hypothetical protein L0I92_08105 [Staphylococcus equorum]|nr:hypothetical protein [Staphylococcus equorum]
MKTTLKDLLPETLYLTGKDLGSMSLESALFLATEVVHEDCAMEIKLEDTDISLGYFETNQGLTLFQINSMDDVEQITNPKKFFAGIFTKNEIKYQQVSAMILVTNETISENLSTALQETESADAEQEVTEQDFRDLLLNLAEHFKEYEDEEENYGDQYSYYEQEEEDLFEETEASKNSYETDYGFMIDSNNSATTKFNSDEHLVLVKYSENGLDGLRTDETESELNGEQFTIEELEQENEKMNSMLKLGATEDESFSTELIKVYRKDNNKPIWINKNI